MLFFRTLYLFLSCITVDVISLAGAVKHDASPEKGSISESCRTSYNSMLTQHNDKLQKAIERMRCHFLGEDLGSKCPEKSDPMKLFVEGDMEAYTNNYDAAIDMEEYDQVEDKMMEHCFQASGVLCRVTYTLTANNDKEGDIVAYFENLLMCAPEPKLSVCTDEDIALLALEQVSYDELDFEATSQHTCQSEDGSAGVYEDEESTQNLEEETSGLADKVVASGNEETNQPVSEAPNADQEVYSTTPPQDVAQEESKQELAIEDGEEQEEQVTSAPVKEEDHGEDEAERENKTLLGDSVTATEQSSVNLIAEENVASEIYNVDEGENINEVDQDADESESEINFDEDVGISLEGVDEDEDEEISLEGVDEDENEEIFLEEEDEEEGMDTAETDGAIDTTEGEDFSYFDPESIDEAEEDESDLPNDSLASFRGTSDELQVAALDNSSGTNLSISDQVAIGLIASLIFLSIV